MAFMNHLALFLVLGGLLFVPLASAVHAQESIVVVIPRDSANPNAPYFWLNEKDGDTTGILHVTAGDTVTWENEDSATHTVTSGTASGGPDDMYDSGLFAPGKSFSYTFADVGSYPYYCVVHPWMEGNVNVSGPFFVLENVGAQIDDGSVSFDMEYGFNRELSLLEIDENGKSISFGIVGHAKNGNHDMELRLPPALIDGPFVVLVDGENVSGFQQYRDDGGMNVLLITLPADSDMLTVVGTSVIPEFGPAGIMTVLAISATILTMISGRLRLRI